MTRKSKYSARIFKNLKSHNCETPRPSFSLVRADSARYTRDAISEFVPATSSTSGIERSVLPSVDNATAARLVIIRQVFESLSRRTTSKIVTSVT